MTQTTKKWDSLVLGWVDFWMVWRCSGIPCLFIFVFFCLEATVKRTCGWDNFCHDYVNYFINFILKVTWYQQLFSKFSTITKHIDNVIWKTPYVRVNSFLYKYNEIKMGESALEIIGCTKIWACFLRNIAPRHFIYYCTLLFLSNKPSSQIQLSVYRINFSTPFLRFWHSVYLGVYPVPLSIFYINQ